MTDAIVASSYSGSQLSESALLDKLNATLQYAQQSRFYRDIKKLVPNRLKSVDDIRSLPCLNKDDIRTADPFDLLAVPVEELYAYHESFGTTGAPVACWFTKSDFQAYADQIGEVDAQIGSEDIVLVRFPYAISCPAHIFTHIVRERGGCVIPCSSRTMVAPHTRVINLMRKLKVSIVGCLPFEIILLAKTAQSMGLDPKTDFPHLRAFCTAGELLTDARRTHIEKIFDVPVYTMFGSTETGNIAAHCRYHELHVAQDHFYIEILDQHTLQPCDYGQRGVLHVTTLNRQAFPFIRYNTGDLAELVRSDCACGRQADILIHHGRHAHVYRTSTGCELSEYDIQQAFLSALADYIDPLFVVVYTPDGIVLRAESVLPLKTIDTGIIDHISQQLGVSVAIELVARGELFNTDKLMRVDPVIKPRYIIDTRAGETYRSLDDILTGYHTFTQQLRTEKNHA